MTYLGLWETKTGDAAFTQFGGLTSLKELNLDSTSVTDESVATLMKFTNLEKLNLRGCQLDEGFAKVAKLPKLKWLNVANTSIDYDIIDELAESRKDLEIVDF